MRTSLGSFAATKLFRYRSETSDGSLSEIGFGFDDGFIVEGRVWREILVDLLNGEKYRRQKRRERPRD